MQNQLLLQQANLLTGGILGTGIQASLQDVLLQGQLIAAGMQQPPADPNQGECNRRLLQSSATAFAVSVTLCFQDGNWILSEEARRLNSP